MKQWENIQEGYYTIENLEKDSVDATMSIENDPNATGKNRIYSVNSFKKNPGDCSLKTQKNGGFLISSDKSKCTLRLNSYLPDIGELSQTVKIYDSDNLLAETININAKVEDNYHTTIRYIDTEGAPFYKINDDLSTIEVGLKSTKDINLKYEFRKRDKYSNYNEKQDFGFNINNNDCKKLKANEECSLTIEFDPSIFAKVNGTKYLTSDDGLTMYIGGFTEGYEQKLPLFEPVHFKFGYVDP